MMHDVCDRVPEFMYWRCANGLGTRLREIAIVTSYKRPYHRPGLPHHLAHTVNTDPPALDILSQQCGSNVCFLVTVFVFKLCQK